MVVGGWLVGVDGGGGAAQPGRVGGWGKRMPLHGRGKVEEGRGRRGKAMTC